MRLKELFVSLADALEESLDIEKLGKAALLEAAPSAFYSGPGVLLNEPFLEVLDEDPTPANTLIKSIPLPWAPPETSSDPLYTAHSTGKSHVELIGPEGIVQTDEIRLGLYGIMPDFHYGIRTHPAEEVFVMLAGEAEWARGGDDYKRHIAGERSFHPSMMEHGTRTKDKAFMSIYIWRGDISTDGYVYHGIKS